MKIHEILAHLRASIGEALAARGAPVPDALRLGTPPEIQQGDFVFECFPLARLLKKNPVQIASEVAAEIAVDEVVEKAEAAGPYVNIKVRNGVLSRAVIHGILSERDRFGRSEVLAAETVVIEYSAPNTNKPMHLGHVRNNTLGSALTTLVEAAGAGVHPVNLVNDRGIHICKSMVAYRRWGKGQTPDSTGKKGDHLIGDFYVLFDQELAKERAAFLEEKGGGGTAAARGEEIEKEFLTRSPLMAEAQECLRKWEDGEPETIGLWRTLNSWVLDGFRRTYELYGCRFEKTYLESETYKLGKEIVEKGLRDGVFSRDPDGSVWVDLSSKGRDRKLLIRSDGTSVYITQDLGTAVLRYEDFHFDRSIYVVGNEQDYHFQVLFEILDLLGYPWAKGCVHMSYGMVYLPEGKMKSREGKVVDADDLFEMMIDLARERILTHFPEMDEKELEEASRAVALGAIKWYLLRVHPGKDIHFDPERSIDFEGATGPAIQYAHTRILSILRKGGLEAEDLGGDVEALEEADLDCLQQAEERQLLRELRRFPERVQQAATAYNPSIVANAMFELAKGFNRFYAEHSVLRAETEELARARLYLVRAVAVVLQNGMHLLGIPMPSRM